MSLTIPTVTRIPINSAPQAKMLPVLRLPFKEVENAFIIVSFKSQRVSREHIDLYTRYQEPYYPGEPFLTFFYAGPNAGAEWAPEHGPIMLYTKCDETWVGETAMGTKMGARRHWFYDYVTDNALSWSQLAVTDERLPQKLAAGDFEGIFHSLKAWALRDE